MLLALGVLALLLVPTIKKTRERGQQLRCMANVRPLIRAVIELYPRDHRLLLPSVTNMMDLRLVLTNYISVTELYDCPADRGSDGPVLPVAAHAFREWGSSYAYATDQAAGAGIANVAGLRITTIEFPTRKAVIFEPPLYHQEGKLSPQDQWHAQVRASVIGFLDGHVDLVLTNYTAPDMANSYY
jgi:hypothetical protein